MKLSRHTAALALAALGASSVAALASATPAVAATDITVGLAASATSDATTDLTTSAAGTAELVCRADAEQYRIGYQGTLSMSTVWTNWRLFRAAYLLAGHTAAEFNALTMVGGFTTSFAVDPDYVDLHPDEFTVDAWQQRYASVNSSTAFPEYMRVTAVSFDAGTGQLEVAYRLRTAGVDGVAAGTIQSNQPATLVFPTAEGSLTVPGDAFEAGRSFDLTGVSLEGSMTVTTLFVSQLPLNFHGTGDPVTIDMVDDGDVATYLYAAADGSELPAEVGATLPASGLADSPAAMATPPAEPAVGTQITVDGQVWTFGGWQAPVVDGCDNASFTGVWQRTPVQLQVEYGFVSGTDGADLPDGVTALLPGPSTADYGSAVVPAALSSESVDTEGGTWTFAGWSPASVDPATSDVSFVGTWTFEAAQVVPTPTPTATPAPDPTPGPTAAVAAGGSSVLAVTGGEPAGLAVVVVSLLAAGGVAVLVRRRLGAGR